jgi:hypothetical protein
VENSKRRAGLTPIDRVSIVAACGYLAQANYFESAQSAHRRSLPPAGTVSSPTDRECLQLGWVSRLCRSSTRKASCGVAGHQCCAVATAADLGSILAGAATFWSRYGDALEVGASHFLWRSTGAIMGNVVNDFLLFSCMALFVTGIVVAAASLLI